MACPICWRRQSFIATGLQRLLLSAAIFMGGSAASAGTFRVPLTGLDQPVAEGGYLTGQFDFGVSFTEIRSIVLEFVMPDGFGTIPFIVGNSVHSRSLTVLMHATDDPFASPEWLPAPFHIAPGETAYAGTFFVTDPETGLCFSGDGPRECGQRDWQDFALSGRGNVTFLDTHNTVFDSYVPGVPSESFTSYGLPGEVESAFLTIVGTPVPEPTGASLLGIATALFLCSPRRRIDRAPASCSTRPPKLS